MHEAEPHLVGQNVSPERALACLPLGKAVVADAGVAGQPLLDQPAEARHREAGRE